MMWNDTRARIKEEKDEDDEEAEVGFNKTNLEGLAKKNQLKPDYVTINPRLAKHFWIPDIFIDQAKQVREPTFHVLPASLRIYRFAQARIKGLVGPRHFLIFVDQKNLGAIAYILSFVSPFFLILTFLGPIFTRRP